MITIYRLCLAASLSMLLASCATTSHQPYQDYAAKNPGWAASEKITFGMTAEEGLASAFAPLGSGVKYSNRVEKVYDYIGATWVEKTLPLDDLYNSSTLRLVVSKQQCSSRSTNVTVTNLAYYMVSKSKLVGFNHAYYKKGCRARQTLQPVNAPAFRYILNDLEEKLI